MTNALIVFVFKQARARTISVNNRLKPKDLLTILKANGHPTPDHYGNRRGGIPHPENSRASYGMMPKHADDTPYFLVERRLPPLPPRLERVV